MMSDTDASPASSAELRHQAHHRAIALLRQLEMDHADLLRWSEGRAQLGAGGVEALANAIVAIDQIRLKLHGG